MSSSTIVSDRIYLLKILNKKSIYYANFYTTLNLRDFLSCLPVYELIFLKFSNLEIVFIPWKLTSRLVNDNEIAFSV